MSRRRGEIRAAIDGEWFDLQDVEAADALLDEVVRSAHRRKQMIESAHRREQIIARARDIVGATALACVIAFSMLLVGLGAVKLAEILGW